MTGSVPPLLRSPRVLEPGSDKFPARRVLRNAGHMAMSSSPGPTPRSPIAGVPKLRPDLPPSPGCRDSHAQGFSNMEEVGGTFMTTFGVGFAFPDADEEEDLIRLNAAASAALKECFAKDKHPFVKPSPTFHDCSRYDGTAPVIDGAKNGDDKFFQQFCDAYKEALATGDTMAAAAVAEAIRAEGWTVPEVIHAPPSRPPLCPSPRNQSGQQQTPSRSDPSVVLPGSPTQPFNGHMRDRPPRNRRASAPSTQGHDEQEVSGGYPRAVASNANPKPATHDVHRESQSTSFLQRLQSAYEEAVANGDTEAASAVADAIRAEGGSVPSIRIGASANCAASPAATASRPPMVPQAHFTGPPSSRLSPKGMPISQRGTNAASPTCYRGRSPRRIRQASRTRAASTSAHHDDTCTGLTPRLRPQEGASAPVACSRSRSPSCCGHEGHVEDVEEPPDEEAEEDDEQEQRGPVQLGVMHYGSAGMALTCLRKAHESATKRRRCGGVSYTARVHAKLVHCDGNLADVVNSLPHSDLPPASCAMLAAWACGYVSGHRCLLDIVPMAIPAGGCQTSTRCSEPGRASWQGMVLLAGLPGGEELMSNLGVRADVFARSPAKCLAEALQAIRAEAGINGPVTLEELHLGLRSLELGARSSGTVGSMLRVAAWRELVRAHMVGKAAGASHTGMHRQNSSPISALASALEAGREGIERRARTQTADDLRTTPPDWDKCRFLLRSAVRILRDQVETIETYGAFALLGVAPNVSDSELKRAYRELCLRHHPDKGGDTAAFQSLQQAYEKILDDRKRGVRPPPPPKPPASPRPSRQSSKTTCGSAPSERPQSCRRGRSAKAENAPNESPRAARASSVPASSSNTEKQRDQSNKSDGQPSPTSPTDDAGDSASQACLQDILFELKRLQAKAADGSEWVRSACGAARAAAEVLDTAASDIPGPEEYSAARAASRSLLESLQTIAKGCCAAGRAAIDASAKIVAVGVLAADGEKAEAVVEASLLCATGGKAAADSAASCETLVDDLSAAVNNSVDDIAVDDDLGKAAAAISLVGLSASARQCHEVLELAETAAARASSAVNGAFDAARAVAPAAAYNAASRGHAPPRPPSRTRAGCTPSDAKDEGTHGSGSEKREQHSNHNSQQPHASASSPKSQSAQSATGEASDEPAHGRPPRRPRGSPHADPTVSHENEGSRHRSRSAGSRGHFEALVKRHMEAFEEMVELNAELRKLQVQLHRLLFRSPLLLPTASSRQKLRVFAVLAELLNETVHLAGETDANAEILISWLPGVKESNAALVNTHTGTLYLATLIDAQAVDSMLREQFLPALIGVRHAESDILTSAVNTAADALQTWAGLKQC